MLLTNRLNRLFPAFIDEPWRSFAALGEQLLNDWEQPLAGLPLGTRAWKSDDGLILEIDLPGRTLQDLDVALEGRRLELTAKAPQESVGRPVRCERRRDDLSFHWTLPFEPAAESTRVSYENGVLRIQVQQSPTAARQKLMVNAS